MNIFVGNRNRPWFDMEYLNKFEFSTLLLILVFIELQKGMHDVLDSWSNNKYVYAFWFTETSYTLILNASIMFPQ